ncbi:hypothetical protein EH31_06545 [Erythrobacter longus]|uniref:Uncharacterized protein n=1 Tax=Erythrobacter longus TaxID=1044 RepID=A0A074M020_ERYLO|nr:hypothetical protein EH31_06545 [Erythrobacter longus]
MHSAQQESIRADHGFAAVDRTQGGQHPLRSVRSALLLSRMLIDLYCRIDLLDCSNSEFTCEMSGSRNSKDIAFAILGFRYPSGIGISLCLDSHHDGVAFPIRSYLDFVLHR